MSRPRLVLGTVVLVVFLGAAATTANAYLGGHPIRPKSGKWKGREKNAHYKLSFKVSHNHKRVGHFKVRVPYDCAGNTPSDYLIFDIPKTTKINPYNGYFSISSGRESVDGLTDDVSLQINGYFSSHGRHAKRVKGGVGTNNFDTLDGDMCNDRFDSWSAKKR